MRRPVYSYAIGSSCDKCDVFKRLGIRHVLFHIKYFSEPATQTCRGRDFTCSVTMSRCRRRTEKYDVGGSMRRKIHTYVERHLLGYATPALVVGADPRMLVISSPINKRTGTKAYISMCAHRIYTRLFPMCYLPYFLMLETSFTIATFSASAIPLSLYILCISDPYLPVSASVLSLNSYCD